MKKLLIVFLVSVLPLNLVHGQTYYQTVIADSGDGIFSILRKNGLDPVTHYEEFVSLNEDNLRNGSELHVGREYKLPKAPNSVKNRGRYIELPSDDETPLFEEGLKYLTRKSDKLNNAVYYLIAENEDSNGSEQSKRQRNEVALNLAKRLLENGAKVYMISKGLSNDLKTNDNKPDGDYVSAINKRFLKHFGKYQRLLMVRSNGLTSSKNLNVSIFHHDGSKDGQKLANSIQEEFKKNSLNPSSKNHAEVFSDKKNLYMAKNMLPALTIIEFSENKKEKNKIGTAIRSDETVLAKLLTSGIFNDYADLEFED